MVNELEEKDHQILDLTANLNFEKEKRVEIERTFEQCEQELKKEISMLNETNKYQQNYASDLKEKDRQIIGKMNF